MPAAALSSAGECLGESRLPPSVRQTPVQHCGRRTDSSSRVLWPRDFCQPHPGGHVAVAAGHVAVAAGVRSRPPWLAQRQPADGLRHGTHVPPAPARVPLQHRRTSLSNTGARPSPTPAHVPLLNPGFPLSILLSLLYPYSSPYCIPCSYTVSRALILYPVL